MTDLEHNIEVNLRGDYARRISAAERSTRRFTRNSTRGLNGLKRVAASAGRTLGGLGKKLGSGALALGGLGGAFSTAAISANLAEAEERFERLGIQANRSRDEMRELKDELFDVASSEGIQIDPKGLFDAVSQIVEKTGDLDFARENAENIALAIQAAGAQGATVGALTAEFKKFGITGKKEVREALDILINQGKAGSFTLANLAQLGERNVSAYAAMGRTGLPAIREMGAALQLIRSGTGSSEQATTAFEALLRTFGNADKLKDVQNLFGIEVFDAEALARGEERLRPINELIGEIIERSGGKQTLLSEVFDAEALRALVAAAGKFKEGNLDQVLSDFFNVNGDGNTLLADSARAAQITTQELRSVADTTEKIADNLLKGGGAKQGLDEFNSILKETEQLSRDANVSLLDLFNRFDQRITAGLFRAVGADSAASRFDGDLPPLNSDINVHVTADPGLKVEATQADQSGQRKRLDTGSTEAGQ